MIVPYIYVCVCVIYIYIYIYMQALGHVMVLLTTWTWYSWCRKSFIVTDMFSITKGLSTCLSYGQPYADMLTTVFHFKRKYCKVGTGLTGLCYLVYLVFTWCSTGCRLLNLYGQILIEGWESRSAETCARLPRVFHLLGDTTQYKGHHFFLCLPKEVPSTYTCEPRTGSIRIQINDLWIMSSPP